MEGDGDEVATAKIRGRIAELRGLLRAGEDDEIKLEDGRAYT